MTTLPVLPDLVAAGVTTPNFIDRLVSYAKPGSSAVWVVRWNGRIRAIQGVGFFYSRESARGAVIKWLRETGRWCFSGHHDVIRRLPRNWSYKKSYRDFITQLLTHMEETGMIEYVELQPALDSAVRPSDAPQALIG